MNLTADQLSTYGRSWVGRVPYVLGAEHDRLTYPNLPPATDCSELVQYFARLIGLEVGDLAAAQWAQTNPISNGYQIGDVVALHNNPARTGFGRGDGIGHIAFALYLDASASPVFLEAAGHDAGVRLSTLAEWRTRPSFAGVGRFPGARKLASATSTSSATRILKLGCTGPDVAALQAWLTHRYAWANTELTPVGGADGKYGLGTLGTVCEWQRRMNEAHGLALDVDGEWGPHSLDAARTFEGWRP